MTNYISGQKVVQLGEGTAWATNVAPTLEMSGIDSLTLAPSIQNQVVRAFRGGIVPGRDVITPRHEVDGSSIGGFVIYEQIPYWINMLQFATEGLTRTWSAPTTAQVDPDLTQLVVGHAGATYGVTSATAKDMTFSWKWGEPLRFNMNLMGYAVTDDALAVLNETASASLTYALASECVTNIDVVTALGDTPATNVMGGTININPNRQYLKRSSSLYPAGVFDAPYWDVTGSLILEADATSIALADAVVAGASRRVFSIVFTNAAQTLTFNISALIKVPSLFTADGELETIDLQWDMIEEGDFTNDPTGEIDGTFQMISVTADADLWA